MSEDKTFKGINGLMRAFSNNGLLRDIPPYTMYINNFEIKEMTVSYSNDTYGYGFTVDITVLLDDYDDSLVERKSGNSFYKDVCFRSIEVLRPVSRLNELGILYLPTLVGYINLDNLMAMELNNKSIITTVR